MLSCFFYWSLSRAIQTRVSSTGARFAHASYLLMEFALFSVFCDSQDGLAPWQPWTRCSVSCGKGEQTRRRECPLPSLPGNMQKMLSEDNGCQDSKSVIITQPCNMIPCSYFEAEIDPSSLSSYSYSLTDPAKLFPNKNDSTATVDQSGFVDYDDDSAMEMAYDTGCSELDYSAACSNSTNERHRLRRAIRLSLGEMIYSNWTPWSTCSCDTETNKRYRFCIVSKRQCLRIKGLFPTVETSHCSCWESTKTRTTKYRSRKFPYDKYDPYSPWSKWSGCPCEKDAFRSRSRMCRPGHEMACFERKQKTGIGIAQLKRCKPTPGCHRIGPMSNLVDERKLLLEYAQQPYPAPARQVPPRPSNRMAVGHRVQAIPPQPAVNYESPGMEEYSPGMPSNTMTAGHRVPAIPPQPEVNYESPGMEEYSPGMEEEYPEELESEEGFVESVASWSAWGEWESCSKSCGTGQATRWRECLDGNHQLTQGCGGGDYTESHNCNTQSCPVIETAPVYNQMPSSSAVEESSYGQESSANFDGVCRAFTSDTLRTEPTSRQPITAGLLDTRPEYDQCPAYYGFMGE
ncbi:SCO-spondin-like isoform X2 [Lytechinus variegatus]|uniref:SCO-spondin-like isoform X2 n=1 Tax=Lytechinus variegatus TaxID=7654 RepID=UPI001BB261B2|nr:SCO-spondin-like isoform X2 [Lytechinus variegatus]